MEIAVATFVVMAITMILPTNVSVYAQTTEDDGYTYDSDDLEEQQEQDEREQEAFDDSGLPEYDEDNDNDDENDNNNDDGAASEPELVECQDGSLMETQELCDQSAAFVQCSDGSYAATVAECPIPDPAFAPGFYAEPVPQEEQLPYCDTDEGKAASSCHDRYDYDDDTDWPHVTMERKKKIH